MNEHIAKISTFVFEKCPLACLSEKQSSFVGECESEEADPPAVLDPISKILC